MSGESLTPTTQSEWFQSTFTLAPDDDGKCLSGEGALTNAIAFHLTNSPSIASLLPDELTRTMFRSSSTNLLGEGIGQKMWGKMQPSDKQSLDDGKSVTIQSKANTDGSVDVQFLLPSGVSHEPATRMTETIAPAYWNAVAEWRLPKPADVKK